MRLLLLLALIGALASACARSAADGPVIAAQMFISLVRAGKCERAWEHMAAASRAYYEELHASFVSHSPYPDREPTAAQLACSPYSDYLPRTVTERSRAGDTVVVSVISRTGTLLPLLPFLSEARKDTPVTMRVVREDGRWKVALHDDGASRARREAIERAEQAERAERARAAARRGR